DYRERRFSEPRPDRVCRISAGYGDWKTFWKFRSARLLCDGNPHASDGEPPHARGLDLRWQINGSVHRTRFPWTPVWANEAGRPEGIGDEPGEGWSGGGDGDGGSGAADGRGATRAVECACQDGDRAAALEGRGARGSVAGDSGAGARAR